MPPGFVPARRAGYLDTAAAAGDVTAYRHYWEPPPWPTWKDIQGRRGRGAAAEAGELIIPPYTSPERSPSHRPVSEVCRDRHSASTSSCRAGGAALEGPVHGGPGHGEQFRQIGDGVVAGGVHAPQFGLLLGRELGLAASESAPARRPCPFGCASDEDVEEHLAHRIGRVVDLPAEGESDAAGGSCRVAPRRNGERTYGAVPSTCLLLVAPLQCTPYRPSARSHGSSWAASAAIAASVTPTASGMAGRSPW